MSRNRLGRSPLVTDKDITEVVFMKVTNTHWEVMGIGRIFYRGNGEHK